MKKISALLIMALLMFSTMQSVTFASESFLITETQLKLSPTIAPNRLLLSFNVSEAIDLSQENTDIIIEYLGENLETTNYIKNKLWGGYLNSYENYPSGETKYSSGYLHENYPDLVPATTIYTVTKTGEKIDIAKVSAVKITVLRPDGSGEQITVGIDGNLLGFEEIEPMNGVEIENPTDETVPPATEQNLGIKIDSETAILPPNTVLVAKELSSGSVFNTVSLLLADAKNFIAVDIKLESNGQTVQPDGKVKISIPIPENFDSSNLVVYRIDNDERKIPYAVTTTANEGIAYATFLTDHFSTYVLVEERKVETQNQTPQITATSPVRGEKGEDSTEIKIEENKLYKKAENEIKENKTYEKIETAENRIPSTGRAKTQNYITSLIIIIGILVLINIKKINFSNQRRNQSQD